MAASCVSSAAQKLNMWTPFSEASSSPSILIWLSKLSHRRTTCVAIESLPWCTECFKNTKKLSLIIQPVGYAAPTVPGGAPFKKISLLKCTRGKINMGGIELPSALTAQHIVTSSSLCRY